MGSGIELVGGEVIICVECGSECDLAQAYADADTVRDSHNESNNVGFLFNTLAS
jgi:glutathione peroxidase-family protein